jgi:hypothetical protein
VRGFVWCPHGICIQRISHTRWGYEARQEDSDRGCPSPSGDARPSGTKSLIRGECPTAQRREPPEYADGGRDCSRSRAGRPHSLRWTGQPMQQSPTVGRTRILSTACLPVWPRG